MTKPDDIVTFQTDSQSGKYAVQDVEDILRVTLAKHGITVRRGSLGIVPQPQCPRCGAAKPAGQSCICFDNGGE